MHCENDKNTTPISNNINKECCGTRLLHCNHVACNNTGDFGPMDRSVIEMTPDLIAQILSKHNTIRMDVANGKVKGKNFTYETASRMIELVTIFFEYISYANYNINYFGYRHGIVNSHRWLF